MSLLMDGVSRRRALSAASTLGLCAFARTSIGYSASMKPSIPFSVTRSGHLLVDASLGDRRLAAVLDSGASANVVSPVVAAALGLLPIAAGRVVGMAGERELNRVQLPPIRLAAYELAPSVAYVADLSGLTISDNTAYDLVLGRPFFQDAVIDIDFSANRIFVSQVNEAVRLQGQVLKISEDPGGRLSIPAAVESLPFVPAVYDFGSAVPLYVAPSYAMKMALMKDKRSSLSATVGMEGIEISQISTLKTLEVGGIHFHDVPFQVPPKWTQKQPLILGLPVLSRFRNVIDLARMTLGLVILKEKKDLPFARDRSGIGGQWLGDRMKVVFVSPGSPAQKAGLREGDEIVALDDDPMGPTLFKKRPKPGSEPAGTIERLKLSSGKTLKITLEDYF